MSYLHTRLGGHEEPEPARDLHPGSPLSTTAGDAHPSSPLDFATIRCRSEVTELHAVNLVADISDAATRAPTVIVDLSITARIDAAGLGALVSGARNCRDAGSVLRIVGATGMVAQALRFTGLSRALSTHPTVEDALRSR